MSLLSPMSENSAMEINPQSRALEGVCVLVVEDNAAMRWAVRRFLERAGCTVMDAETPSEALGVARGYPERIDRALVDLILPEMSGPECADMLALERAELVVAYMSGYAGLVSEGCDGDDPPVLLQKPFARGELLKTIQGLLGMASAPTTVAAQF